MGETAVDVLVHEHDDLRRLFAKLSDPEADRVGIWLQIVKEVATHVAVERTFVYPLVRRLGLGRASLAEDLHRDYKQMEHLLVLTERRKINSPDMPDLVGRLLDIFEAHKLRCETVLAPLMVGRLSPGELQDLGDKMRGAENVIVSHPHPHLLATGPFYRLTTRLASRWDRFRDRGVRNR